jgi:hypothetical protein
METYKLTYIDKYLSKKVSCNYNTWEQLTAIVFALHTSQPDIEIISITRIIEKELRAPQQKELQTILTPTWQHD